MLFGVINIFCFLARLASLLPKPWCIMLEQGDTTRPAVDFSEPSEAVKESKKLSTQNIDFLGLISQNQTTQLHCI